MLETKGEKKQFAKKVYRLILQIPKGKVATYGDIAALAGTPKNARLVGRLLCWAPKEVPCHRVVGYRGQIAPGWDAQKELLQKEGVIFLENGCVHMGLHRWKRGE